jgi:hypothetical protein
MLPIRYKINKKYPLELGILPARLKKNDGKKHEPKLLRKNSRF